MKKITITLDDLFDLPGAEIFNPDSLKPISSVTIDSRNVKKGSLFIAIKGERFDGHTFVKDVAREGASAVIISRKKLKQFDGLNIPFITVEDTIKTLGDVAKIWRSKLTTKVIGITGSNGKTSTKEILATLLSEKFNVNKTAANNNNHIGVPLTILSTTNKYDVLVAECGTNHFGEIEYTANILQPDIAVITNIGTSHLEFLKNKKGVLKEKKALLDSTVRRNGQIFINNNDPYLNKLYKDYSHRNTFAYSEEADVIGKINGYSKDSKTLVTIASTTKKIESVFPLYGENNVKNLICAVSISLKFGLKKEDIQKGIAKLKAVPKRLNVKRFKNFILVDDTYNANPESMKFAIELVGNLGTEKSKILILGDMFELGDSALSEHRKLASVIKRNKINAVLTIGKFMKELNNSLSKSKVEAKHFSNKKNLEKYLLKYNFQNSVVLVKGSRGMKMEDFVKVIEDRDNK